MHKFLKIPLFSLVVLTAATTSNAAFSHPMHDMGPRDGCTTHSPFTMPPHQRHGFHRGQFIPPFPIDLQLTETQLDKIFEIRHAAEPTIREKMKIIRSSHKDLHELMLSKNFDETKARPLIAASSKAMSELELLRAKNYNSMLKLLTSDQYKKFKEQMGKNSMEQAENDRK